jgi:hypothetical protein
MVYGSDVYVAVALLVSIIPLAVWSGWVVRTGRARRSVMYIPVAASLIPVGCEVLTLRAVFASFDATPAKSTLLVSERLRYATALQPAAWSCIAIAALVLVIFSLRAPSDPDGPSARVVREPRRDQ